MSKPQKTEEHLLSLRQLLSQYVASVYLPFAQKEVKGNEHLHNFNIEEKVGMGYFRQPFMAQRKHEPRLPPRIALKLSTIILCRCLYVHIILSLVSVSSSLFHHLPDDTENNFSHCASTAM